MKDASVGVGSEEERKEWLEKGFFEKWPKFVNNGEVEALLHISNGDPIPSEVMRAIRFSSFSTTPNLENQFEGWNDLTGIKPVGPNLKLVSYRCLSNALIVRELIEQEGHSDFTSKPFSRLTEILEMAVELMDYRQQVGGKHGGA
ncbi:MAG: hypothetical protein V1810_02175 [Candidatus Beckwithbacteria bacterium]